MEGEGRRGKGWRGKGRGGRGKRGRGGGRGGGGGRSGRGGRGRNKLGPSHFSRRKERTECEVDLENINVVPVLHELHEDVKVVLGVQQLW